MRALVIGSSGGIGAAIAEELQQRGTRVTSLSRRNEGLDVTDETSVAAVLAGLEAPFDLIFVATGALVVGDNGPEKSLRALSAEGLEGQFAINALGPALVLKHAVRLMPRNRRAVFAVLSARVGSIGDNLAGGWYSYRAAKAALNQIVHGAAIEVARTHPHAVLALLHPGTVDTAFTAEYPAHDKLTPEVAARRLLNVLDGLGPEHSGQFYDHAGVPVPW